MKTVVTQAGLADMTLEDRELSLTVDASRLRPVRAAAAIQASVPGQIGSLAARRLFQPLLSGKTAHPRPHG